MGAIVRGAVVLRGQLSGYPMVYVYPNNAVQPTLEFLAEWQLLHSCRCTPNPGILQSALQISKLNGSPNSICSYITSRGSLLEEMAAGTQ